MLNVRYSVHFEPPVELGRGTPYMIYWKAPPERAQVYERVALSRVGVCEMVEKSAI